jgi:hypothetical protein
MATGNESPKTRQLLLYSSLMSLPINAVNPCFLLDIPTSHMLKNILHASASQITGFRLATGIPFYLGFVFGMARDHWSPFGRLPGVGAEFREPDELTAIRRDTLRPFGWWLLRLSLS